MGLIRDEVHKHQGNQSTALFTQDWRLVIYLPLLLSIVGLYICIMVTEKHRLSFYTLTSMKLMADLDCHQSTRGYHLHPYCKKNKKIMHAASSVTLIVCIMEADARRVNLLLQDKYFYLAVTRRNLNLFARPRSVTAIFWVVLVEKIHHGVDILFGMINSIESACMHMPVLLIVVFVVRTVGHNFILRFDVFFKQGFLPWQHWDSGLSPRVVKAN